MNERGEVSSRKGICCFPLKCLKHATWKSIVLSLSSSSSHWWSYPPKIQNSNRTVSTRIRTGKAKGKQKKRNWVCIFCRNQDNHLSQHGLFLSACMPCEQEGFASGCLPHHRALLIWYPSDHSSSTLPSDTAILTNTERGSHHHVSQRFSNLL